MLEPVAGETLGILGCGLSGPLVDFAMASLIRTDVYETRSQVEQIRPSTSPNLTFLPAEHLSRTRHIYDLFVITEVGRIPLPPRELLCQIHRVLADGGRLLVVDAVGIDARPGEASAIMGRPVHDSFPLANALTDAGLVMADRRDLSQDVAALVRERLADSVSVFGTINRKNGARQARVAAELVCQLELWATVHRSINAGALGVGAFLARKPSRVR
jgi:hypothetical protein